MSISFCLWQKFSGIYSFEKENIASTCTLLVYEKAEKEYKISLVSVEEESLGKMNTEIFCSWFKLQEIRYF